MKMRVPTILIVDDKPHNLRFFSKMLEAEGYQVQRAISGQLALNAAIASPPDLILLDIIMPQMNGYEVCQRLKNNPKTATIPVIFVSGLQEAKEKVKAFEVGGVDYISKPFQRAEILARIEHQLTIRSLQQQVQEHNIRLQESENLLTSILNHSLDGIAAFATLRNDRGIIEDFRGLVINPAAELLFGKNLVGERMLMKMPGKVKRRLFDLYVSVVETDVPQKAEVYYEDQGLEKWLQMVVVKLGDGIALTFRDVSEQKQALAAVVESEARFRAMADSTAVLMWVDDEEGRCIFSNQTRLDFKGCHLAEELGLGRWRGVHPDEVEQLENIYRQARFVSAAFEVEYRLRRASGEYRWIFEQARPRFSPGNVFAGYIGSGIDITERRLMEQELLETQNFIEGIANATPNLLYVYDLVAQRNIYVNQSIINLLGYAPQDIQALGDRFFPEIMHPEDLAQIPNHIEHLLKAKAGEVIEIEYRMRHQNGQWVWLHGWEVVYRRAPDGTPWQTLGTAADVTKRRQMEEQLLEQESFIEGIANATPNLLYVYDLVADRNVYLNPTIHTMLGYTPQELQALGDRLFLALMHPEDLAKMPDNLQRLQVLGDGKIIEFEYRMRHQNGQWLWLHSWEVIYRRSPDGSPWQMLGTAADVTKRRQMEQALAEQEELWQLVLEGTGDGIWDWKIATGEVFFSPRCATLLGEQEIPNDINIWQGRIHPEDAQRVRKTIENYLGRRIEDYAVEYRLRCADGSYKWLLNRGLALWNESGEPVRFVGSAQDISDRKQAEEALLASQQRLAFLVEQTPVAVIEWDLRGVVMAWNQAAEGIFGWTAQEAIGTISLGALVPQNIKSHIPQVIQQWLNQPAISINENLTKTGKIRVCEWYNTRLVNKQREAIGFASIAVDITERRQQELLEKAQNKLLKMSAFGQSLKEILQELVKEVEGLIPKLSEAMVLLNFASEHLYFWSNPDLPQADIQALQELQGVTGKPLWNETLTTGDRFFIEDLASYIIEQKRDIVLALNLQSCWCEPIRSESHLNNEELTPGERPQVLGVLVLYLQEARAPEYRSLEVIQSLTRLVGLIIERKQVEIALKQAKEAAESASRAKSNFLAVTSHELRTPLNAILGFSQLLNQDSSLKKEQREQIAIINRSGEHLLNLINDILSMSKIERGRLVLHEENFHLYQFLASLQETFNLQARRKGLHFSFNIVGNLPEYIRIDAGKLRQVLQNLVGNAIKFTEMGSVVIKVTYQEELGEVGKDGDNSSDSRNLTFAIEDTGIGIESHLLESLFTPFVQTRTGRELEGTGLGLSISREFVRLLGGELEVRSQVAKGSVFSFTIPIVVVTDCVPEYDVLKNGRDSIDQFGTGSDLAANLHHSFLTPLNIDTISPTTMTKIKAKFALMSRPWQEQLHLAAKELNDELIIDLIAELPPEEEELKQIISDLVYNFRLDIILDLTEFSSE